MHFQQPKAESGTSNSVHYHLFCSEVWQS